MKIIYIPGSGPIFLLVPLELLRLALGVLLVLGLRSLAHELGDSWGLVILRVSQAFFIFEGNVQLWINQHFWCGFFWKSSTNRASHVEHAHLPWQVLDPIVVFITSSPEDIIAITNSQMPKQHTHYKTVKIFLHLSQLPALHCVLKFN